MFRRTFTAVNNKKIHWPGGKEGPPPDIPKCGFLGNSPECMGHSKFVLTIL